MARDRVVYMLAHDDPVLWYRLKVMVATKKTSIKAVILDALEKAVNDFEEEEL